MEWAYETVDARGFTAMKSSDVLVEGYERIQGLVHGAVKDLSPEQLAYRVDEDANSIAWLLWHLARIQDDHIGHVAGRPQVWISSGWKDRCGLPFEATATGYGHSSADVAKVKDVSGDLLVGYYDAVHAQSLAYLNDLTDADLDRIVDERWTPPVTLGARLVSVLSDNLQHAGQAAFVRGVILRR